MSLPPGLCLGPYEIVAPLGAGGMGEVYRARDDRIGRDVAVKVLPAALAKDDGRLQRFEREARAAGRLNHPNVLTVHDVGRHDGTLYVVSELLEGETLRERLRGSALPVRKATEISVQIARGLAAAHEQGIVHRDLKPENVFVVKDGQVKILDFGLAKLTRGESGQEAGSDVHTDAYGTDPGTVMGTVGYMSPEQVRGRAVDHRSDIFSLGAILYEMLSGRRAFVRDSSVETLNAILKEDPLEASSIGRPLPPALDRIVRHCLEKSPDERFASARDLAFDLQALSEVSASAPAVSGRRVTKRRVLVAFAGLGLAGLGFGSGFLVGGSSPPPAPRYQQLTFRRGLLGSAVFGGDGSTVFYSAAWDGKPMEVFVREPGSTESRPLGLAGWVVAALQDELAVHTHDGTVVKVPRQGGAPRPWLSHIDAAFAAGEGSTLGVVRREKGRVRIELPPGRVRYETPDELAFPRVAPAGGLIAFVKRPSGGFSSGRLAVVDRAGRELALSEWWDDLSCGVAWSASAREVWYAAAQSGSMDCELRAISVAGKDRLVARLPGSLQLLDIAPDGRVLLGHEKRRYETRGRLPGEAAERDLSWFDRTNLDDLTPDGRMMVFNESGRGGGPRESAFLRPVDGSPAVKLGDGMALAVSPDGRWVATTLEGGHGMVSRLFLVPAGAGEPRPLTAGTIAAYSDVWWFPDGKRLLLDAQEAGRPRRLFMQELPDGAPKGVTPEGVATRPNTSPISPDGKWIAAQRLEPGAPFELYPLSAGEPRAITGLESRETPLRWSGDGRSLFVRAAQTSPLPVRVVKVDLKTGRRAPWLSLTPPDPAGVNNILDVMLSADGRGYVYTYGRRLGDLYLAEGLR
jgi:hypothetical protein